MYSYKLFKIFVHREKKNGKHTLWILGESYEFNEKKKMVNHWYQTVVSEIDFKTVGWFYEIIPPIKSERYV